MEVIATESNTNYNETGYGRLQKEVLDIMGGKVLDYPGRQAFYDGKAVGKAEDVKNIMKNMGLDVEKAMQILDIPAEEQKTIRELVLEPEEATT